MERKPGLTVPPNGFEEWCYEKADSKVLILSEAPTAAIPLLTEGQRGFFGTKLYRVIGGTLFESTLTQTA